MQISCSQAQNTESKHVERARHTQRNIYNDVMKCLPPVNAVDVEKKHTISVFYVRYVSLQCDEQDRVSNVCLHSPNYGKRLNLVYSIGCIRWSVGRNVSSAVIFSATHFLFLYFSETHKQNSE